jgi:hypothetical protein
VDEEDELLLELIADRVESLCGYKPDPDATASFLKTNVKLSEHAATRAPTRSVTASQEGTEGSADLQSYGFTVHGKRCRARNARDVLTSVFRTLASRDPSFLERFSALPKHGRTRRYLARTPEELYPGRADLARDHSVEVQPGWWLGINLSRAAVKRIVEMACEVSGLRFGRDLTLVLGE